jgi:hypothetical protein
MLERTLFWLGRPPLHDSATAFTLHPSTVPILFVRHPLAQVPQDVLRSASRSNPGSTPPNHRWAGG